MKLLLSLLLISLICPARGHAQAVVRSRWQINLRFHVLNAYGPWPVAAAVVYAAHLQQTNSPREWGQGWDAYGERLGSTLAYSGIRNTLGLGLDSLMHEDPRYFRTGSGSYLRRAGHVVGGTVMSRTESGGQTVAVWRFGSAYGAAFLANKWRPDRVNTPWLGVQEGTTQIGVDLLRNAAIEFWPDISRRFRR